MSYAAPCNGPRLPGVGRSFLERPRDDKNTQEWSQTCSRWGCETETTRSLGEGTPHPGSGLSKPQCPFCFNLPVALRGRLGHHLCPTFSSTATSSVNEANGERRCLNVNWTLHVSQLIRELLLFYVSDESTTLAWRKQKTRKRKHFQLCNYSNSCCFLETFRRPREAAWR